MPSFWSGLLNAGSAAATGYAQGDAANIRALVAEKARRAAADRAAREADEAMKLRRISTLGTAASQGLDISSISPRVASGQAPTSPEGGLEAPVRGPISGPRTSGDPVNAPAPGAPPTSGTPIGDVGGYRVSVPPGGVVDKAARSDALKRSNAVNERKAHLTAYNDSLEPGHPHKLSEQQLALVANDDALYNKFTEGALGLGPPKNIDPLSPAGVQAAVEREVAVKKRLKELGLLDKPPTEPKWQIIQTADGVQQVNPTTGEIRPVVGPDGQPVRPKVPATLQAKIADNKRSVSVIDSALRELAAHPDAVGFTRGRIDAIDQRLDPKGVNARAAIADVGSIILHTRSGAAVTVSEYPRLAPFVPTAHDDLPTVRQKLTRLRKHALEETGWLEGTDVGAAPPTAAAAPAGPAASAPPTTTRTAGPPPAGKRSAAPNRLSDADLWEKFVNGGMSPEAATRSVKNRQRP